MKVFPVDHSAQEVLKKTVIDAWPAVAVLFLTVVVSVFFQN